jgi:hypothetical protein
MTNNDERELKGGFETYVSVLKNRLSYVEDSTFSWDDTTGLLIVKLSNTDSINKENEASNATQIQLTSERDASAGSRKTEDFFPTLTLNTTFKGWRICIPARLNKKNLAALGADTAGIMEEWKDDHVQIRRRILNADAQGNGNPTLQICYGDDLMPLRKALGVDDYIVFVKRKDASVYEAFGVLKDVNLGKGKQMYTSDKKDRDSTDFMLSDIATQIGTDEDELNVEDLEERNKRNFRAWMENQVKPEGDSDAGNPYSESSIDQYVSNVSNTPLLLKPDKSLFYTTNVEEVQSTLGELDNSEKKNNTQRSAIRKYIEYLKTLVLDDDSNDVLNHSLFGIHIKEKNDALSEDNPHVCIGWSSIGDLSDIHSREELATRYDEHYDKNPRGKGQDVGQIWRFLNDVKMGDYIIFAESSVFHIGRIESDYFYLPCEGNPNQSPDYVNNRRVKWLKTNLSRTILSASMHNALKTAMSLWSMNDYKSVVAELLRDSYVRDEIEMSDEGDGMKSCLEISREPRTADVYPLNFIVYGAPGTGKTYSMVEYALAIIDNVKIEDFRAANTDRRANVSRYKELVKAGQIVFTTFHQNYGYEEFIQGLRPDKNSETMAFKTVDGVFKVIADTALNDTENRNYVIIIDEINRANISKVFGELITLIEGDKRWGELNETSATLQSGDPFAVPNNLYIVGTMNSADKSISLIDAALRRRFDFIEQKPDASLVTDAVLRAMLEIINLSLVEELDSTDLLVGHSYFMNKTEADLCNILNNNIIPLLYEYFYDNRKKVANLLNDAIKKAGAKVEIVDEKVGRLRVKEV